jgi:ABC-type amino acid transport system permease subunit
MTEQLHFSELWPHWPELLAGLWVTIQLTVLATIGGLAIGIFGAAIRSGRPRGSAGSGAGMWKSSATRRLWCSCFLSSLAYRIWG